MIKQVYVFIFTMLVIGCLYLGYDNYKLRQVDVSTRILWKDSVVTRVKSVDTTVYHIKHIARIIKEDTTYKVGFKYKDRYIDIGCTTYWSSKGSSYYNLKYLSAPDTIKHIVMQWRGIPSSMVDVNGYMYPAQTTYNGINAGNIEQRPEWDRAWIGAVVILVFLGGTIWLVK